MVNSGSPQGAFLKRQMVLKQDGSGLPFSPDDFNVGLDIGICGRSIRIYDCDDYTRQYFGVSIILKRFLNIYLQNLGKIQAQEQVCPVDAFVNSCKPRAPTKDPELLEYLEKKLGGGKVAS